MNNNKHLSCWQKLLSKICTRYSSSLDKTPVLPVKPIQLTFIADKSKVRLLCCCEHLVDDMKPFVQVVEACRIRYIVHQQNSLCKILKLS